MKKILSKIISLTCAASLMLITTINTNIVSAESTETETEVYGILQSDGTVYTADSTGTKINDEEVTKNTLTHLFVANDVETIKEYEFTYSENLTTVDFTGATSLKLIDEQAFTFCANLTTVDLTGATSLEGIAYSAFCACEKLTTITVDADDANFAVEDGVLFSKDKTTLIKYPAGKTDETYTIPSTVETISNYSFENCSFLNEINFDNASNLKTIGKNAFTFCDNLTAMDLSKCTLIETIGDYAFDKCIKLTNININEDNANFSSKDGVLFSKDKKTLFIYPHSKTGDTYTIPSTVEIIEGGAFENCLSLKEIDFSQASNLKTIYFAVFNDCDNLTTLDFTACSNLKDISKYAFASCDNLTTVNFSGATSLETMTAAFDSCDNLTTVNFSGATNLKNIGGVTFQCCNNLKTINFSKVINLKSIGQGTFSQCTNLTTIDLSDAVKLEEIGEGAFNGCAALKNIYVSDSSKIALFNGKIPDSCEVSVKKDTTKPDDSSAGDDTSAGDDSSTGDDKDTTKSDDTTIFKPIIPGEESNTIFTIEELASGKDLDLEIKIDEIKKENIDKTDKKIIDNFIKTLDKKVVIGSVLDIDFEKIVGTKTTKLTNLPFEVEINVDVPEAIKGKNKEFAIIRVHDGKATLLKDLDKNPDTITFKTDKFSTYAVIEIEPIAKSDNPKTQDTSNVWLLVILQLGFLSAIKIAYNKKVRS